jgi:hypothetical protein
MTMDAERSGLAATGEPGRTWAAEDPRPPEDGVEQALAHGERLLEAVDSGRRRMAVVTAVSSVVMVAVVLGIVLGTLEAHGSLTAWTAAVIASAVFLAAASSAARRLLVTLRSQVRRDELIMVDLIGRQRELVSLLARKEKWSPARIYLTERRLERFPVDVGSPPGQYRRLRR